MNRDIVLDILQRVLDLAQQTVAAAPVPVHHPELVDDLRALLSALYFVLRRYRDAIIEMIDDAGS